MWQGWRWAVTMRENYSGILQNSKGLSKQYTDDTIHTKD